MVADLPYAETEVVSATIASAATNTQIAKMPWPNPAAGKGSLHKIYVSNSQATAAVVVLWDQDLSDATPTARGSAAAPLFRINVPASSDVMVPSDRLPEVWFQAGIAAQSSQVSCFISVEYEKQLG